MNWVSCGGKQLWVVDFGLTLADILPDEKKRRGKPDLPDNPKQIVIPNTSREKEGPEPWLLMSCCCCCGLTLHGISAVISYSFHIRLLVDYRVWA